MAAQTERQCFHTMLRNYQHNIKQSLISEWERHCSIMVQMPTGTGKTHLLASLVNDELRTRNEESCVWIVAHRRELVEQIETTVSRYGVSKEDGSVKVLSIQWLSRHWDDVKNEKPGLIVIDEAHHALAETYKELWLRYPNAKKLGMTATPCRLNRKGFTDLFEVLITSDSIADRRFGETGCGWGFPSEGNGHCVEPPSDYRAVVSKCAAICPWKERYRLRHKHQPCPKYRFVL